MGGSGRPIYFDPYFLRVRLKKMKIRIKLGHISRVRTGLQPIRTWAGLAHATLSILTFF